MTQVWPVFGVAPVPTLLSVIFSPEGVVIMAPAAWAFAVVGEALAMAAATAVTKARAAAARTMRAFRDTNCMLSLLAVRNGARSGGLTGKSPNHPHRSGGL